jgi:hypothetical protein
MLTEEQVIKRRERDRKYLAKRRLDPVFRLKQNEYIKLWQANRKLDPVFKAKNNERIKLYSRKRLLDPNFRAKHNKICAFYKAKRLKTDILFKLKERLQKRLSAVVRNNLKSYKTIEMLGCTIQHFKIHLETRFTEGMTWDNYGKWHIDHIKPCASFNFNDPKQQKECFHYSNLQPLWAIDNIRKSDKFNYHLLTPIV